MFCCSMTSYVYLRYSQLFQNYHFNNEDKDKPKSIVFHHFQHLLTNPFKFALVGLFRSVNVLRMNKIIIKKKLSLNLATAQLHWVCLPFGTFQYLLQK